MWLQYFSWTEKSHAKKIQKRNDFDGLNTAALGGEPMFCFETAVKMLYWCTLAYEYQEVSCVHQSCQAATKVVLHVKHIPVCLVPVVNGQGLSQAESLC